MVDLANDVLNICKKQIKNLRETDCAKIYLNNFDDSKNWFNGNSELEKFCIYRDKETSKYDADGCGYYSSKEICEFYERYWPKIIRVVQKNRRNCSVEEKNILKWDFEGTHPNYKSMAGETLISPYNCLKRVGYDLNKYQDYNNINKYYRNEIELFCYLTGTKGNFMPIPSTRIESNTRKQCLQGMLNNLGERFDFELLVFKSYYESKECENSKINVWIDFLNDIKEINPNNPITSWLNEFGGWRDFVNKNYFIESFVDSEYNIVSLESKGLDVIKKANKILLKRNLYFNDITDEKIFEYIHK